MLPLTPPPGFRFHSPYARVHGRASHVQEAPRNHCFACFGPFLGRLRGHELVEGGIREVGMSLVHGKPRDMGEHRENANEPWTVLLAGGEGRRLSSFIRTVHADDRPKQFATIIGTRSMLQHTYDRALRHSLPERILIAITAGQERWAFEQLPWAPERNFLVQPRNLDTGPAIALAVAHVMAQDPSGSILVLPTDHFVYPEESLERILADVLLNLGRIDETSMILLGANPSGPSEGLGWILPERAVENGNRSRFLKVRDFVEKPKREVAQRLYANGALWNTFILAGKVHAFWHSLRKRVPEVTSRLARACYQLDQDTRVRKAKQVFSNIEPFNFSTRVLAHGAGRLFVMPLEGVHWNDWGTPEGVLESIELMGWEHRLRVSLSRPRTLRSMATPEFAGLTEEVRGRLQASGALD